MKLLEIVPPAVPQLESKRGFFQKLFSRKPKDSNAHTNSQNDLNANLDNMPIPELPDLPSMDLSNVSSQGDKEMAEEGRKELVLPPRLSKKFGKSKGKGRKKNITRVDLTKNFDWDQSIVDQNDLIKDSIRNNQDINQVLDDSTQHIEDQKKVLDTQFLSLPDSIPDMDLDNPVVPEIHTDAVPIPEPERKFFGNVEKNHNRLREKLKEKMKKSSRQEFLALLREYDQRIELKIEQKQIEFTQKKLKLSDLSRNLTTKQKELNSLQTTLKGLELRLNDKQSKIDQIINRNTEKQLASRLKKERFMLKKELQKTISMNKELKKKLDIIEKDRMLFENTRDKIRDEHRRKLTEMQQTYEKKLSELNAERQEFEQKKKNSMELLRKADLLQREKNDLDKLREMVEQKKQAVNERLYEDRELKHAIDNAEMKLSEDREKLDNMMFSKYIKWKLSEPDDSEKITDILRNPKVEEIDNLIVNCRSLLLNSKINDAKKLYNVIKHKFETSEIDAFNRSSLFNSIRELYGDINLAALKL